MKKKFFFKRFVFLLVLFGFVSLSVLSFIEKEVDELSAQEKIDGYRRLLEKFINQDWSIIALKHNASGSVLKELPHFVNKESECIRFFNTGEEVGSYGNCMKKNSIRVSSIPDGLSSYSRNIFLYEKYRKGVEMLLIMDNPEEFEVINGRVHIPLLMRHIYSSLPLFFLSLLIFILSFTIYCVVESIKEQRENSRNKVHDFSNLTSDEEFIADELELIAQDPQSILDLAKRIRKTSTLKRSVLYHGPADRTSDHNLFDLIQEFCDGFFETKDRSVFLMNSFSHGIYVHVDKRIFQRAMSNLFDNAFKHIIGKGMFSLSVLEYPDKVEILVSNEGTISNVKHLFKYGFSTRGSSGRGLSIVDDAVSKMGSDVYLIQDKNNISFSFYLPIVKEKSWPVFYA